MLLATSFVVAVDDTSTYLANTPIDFKSSCLYNGTYCSNVAVCNITLTYPQGGIYANNLQLQNQVSFYNRTLPATNYLGFYSGNIVCYDSVAGYSGSIPVSFQVTSTGNTQAGNLTIFLLLLGVSIVVLIISLLLSNIYVGFLGGISFILSGMYNNIYGIGIEQNMYTTGIGMLVIGVGVVIFIMCGYQAMNSNGEAGFSIGRKDDGGDDNDIYNFTQEKEVDD